MRSYILASLMRKKISQRGGGIKALPRLAAEQSKAGAECRRDSFPPPAGTNRYTTEFSGFVQTNKKSLLKARLPFS
jgi:hypothetical protein